MTWGTPYSQRQGAPKIDLLPRQLVEQRQTLRQRSGIGAGFLVLLAVLGIWYAMESRQLNQAREQADQERAVATGLRARRAQLQPLADLESQIAAAEQLRASVYKREVRFSSVMRDISAIVPDDVWLTSMAVAYSATNPPTPANVAFTGWHDIPGAANEGEFHYSATNLASQGSSRWSRPAGCGGCSGPSGPACAAGASSTTCT